MTDAGGVVSFPRWWVAVSEEEQHAIAHARYQVEHASPDNPECCFDYDLVADLLCVIDRASPPPSGVTLLLAKRALEQAQDCIIGEAPPDITRKELRENTLNKISKALKCLAS